MTNSTVISLSWHLTSEHQSHGLNFHHHTRVKQETGRVDYFCFYCGTLRWHVLIVPSVRPVVLMGTYIYTVSATLGVAVILVISSNLLYVVNGEYQVVLHQVIGFCFQFICAGACTCDLTTNEQCSNMLTHWGGFLGQLMEQSHDGSSCYLLLLITENIFCHKKHYNHFSNFILILVLNAVATNGLIPSCGVLWPWYVGDLSCTLTEEHREGCGDRIPAVHWNFPPKNHWAVCCSPSQSRSTGQCYFCHF